MFYMSRRGHHVGVRELRQNLSIYLRRVTAGEVLQVTDRGRPVAILTALSEVASPLEILTTTGRASSPRGDLLDLAPPRRWRGKGSLSEALRATREERL
jgi:prevent-host-death family protein